MAQFEGGRGGSVVLPPAEPLAQPHPVLVTHGGRGLVAHPPAGRAQPPDEIHVLSYLHVLGETRSGGRPAQHEGGAGDIRHARPGPDDAGPLTHVESGTRPLVPRQPGSSRLVRHDARRHRAHRGVGEVRQQRVQPAGPGHAVRVEKRHQRRVRRRQAAVPGCRRAAVHRPPQYAGPGLLGDGLDGRGITGAVVHHDHPRRPRQPRAARTRSGQPGQAAGQFGVAVTDRDDHRHLRLARRREIVQHRMGDPGVEEAPGQRAGLGVARYGRARPPAGHVPGPGRAQPEHPGGITTGDDRPALEARQRDRPRIRTQPEFRRDQLVSRPRSRQGHWAVRLPRPGSLRHAPRLLRALPFDPARPVTAKPPGCHDAGTPT
jgi:hypothetical protein